MLELHAPALSQSCQRSLEGLLQNALDTVFPAVSMCVIQHGQTVLNAHGGNNEGAALAHDARFDLASITKLFTTTAVLQLISAGRLGLHTRLCDIVPEFSRSGPRWTDAAQSPHTLARLPMDQPTLPVDPEDVEIHHLLTHSSGLHDWRDLFMQLGACPEPPMAGRIPEQKQQQAIELVGQLGFRSRPGPIVYSDLGFILLGEVVSRLQGRPLDHVLSTQVMAPLSLPDIVFNPVTHGHLALSRTVSTEWDARWRGRRVWGEVHDENACAMGGVAGHAGLFGTAESVARFGLAWLGTGQSQWQINPTLFEQAKRAQIEQGTQRRGWGFMCKSSAGSSCGRFFSSRSFGHTGFTGTSLWIDPDRQLVVATLSNAVHRGRDMKPMFNFRVALHEMLSEFFKE